MPSFAGKSKREKGCSARRRSNQPHRCTLVHSGAEQKRYAPQAGQTYNTVDHAAGQGKGAAEAERHQIQVKQANAAPVDGANDHNDQYGPAKT